METPATPIVNDKPTSVAETLRAARALIEDPKRWTKGTYARRARSLRWVSPQDPAAKRFCMLGALRRVDGPYERAAGKVLTTVLPKKALRHIPTFNDDPQTTHTDVLAAFDKAIAKAESRP